MNIFWSRVFIVFAAPFVVPYTFLASLTMEVAASFRFAWLDVRLECDWIRQSWIHGVKRRS